RGRSRFSEAGECESGEPRTTDDHAAFEGEGQHGESSFESTTAIGATGASSTFPHDTYLTSTSTTFERFPAPVPIAASCSQMLTGAGNEGSSAKLWLPGMVPNGTSKNGCARSMKRAPSGFTKSSPGAAPATSRSVSPLVPEVVSVSVPPGVGVPLT